MAYDSTIPALGNLISNDIPAMQENFSLLESAQVVDEGSTADGDYIRYENGWQICWFTDYSVAEDFTDELSSSVLYRTESGEKDWNLPNSFVDDNYYIAGTANRDVAGSPFISGCIGDAKKVSNDLAQYAAVTIRTVENSFNVNYHVIAIGRWK